MKTYLVTGAAGFIGSNFLKYMLGKYDDIRIIVLDALTYAGYLGTISEDIDNERCIFIRGNICDRNLADQLFAEYKFDYIINFAAESHVDRSIENPQLFLQTNILGTQNLLDAARCAWVTGKDEKDTLHGVNTYVSIRYLPTKCMAPWEPKDSLRKKLLSARTARTAHQKPVPT